MSKSIQQVIEELRRQTYGYAGDFRLHGLGVTFAEFRKVLDAANASAENAREIERLRGLVRELRADRFRHQPFPQVNRLDGEEHNDFVARVNQAGAKQRADYDAATEALLEPNP